MDTEIARDGQFWCQLFLPDEDHNYSRLHYKLQTAATTHTEDGPLPVPYCGGDVCAACFSKDGEWHRAQIETVLSGMVQYRKEYVRIFHITYRYVQTLFMNYMYNE